MGDYKYKKEIWVCDSAWDRRVVSDALLRFAHCMFDTNEKNNESYEQNQRFCIDIVPTRSLGTIGIRMRWGKE